MTKQELDELLESAAEQERMNRTLTQGGDCHWMCPVCKDFSSALHFEAGPVTIEEDKWFGYALRLFCERGHRFTVSLREGKGSMFFDCERGIDWDHAASTEPIDV
jgi:hypothetical protein